MHSFFKSWFFIVGTVSSMLALGSVASASHFVEDEVIINEVIAQDISQNDEVSSLQTQLASIISTINDIKMRLAAASIDNVAISNSLDSLTTAITCPSPNIVSDLKRGSADLIISRNPVVRARGEVTALQEFLWQYRGRYINNDMWKPLNELTSKSDLVTGTYGTRTASIVKAFQNQFGGAERWEAEFGKVLQGTRASILKQCAAPSLPPPPVESPPTAPRLVYRYAQWTNVNLGYQDFSTNENGFIFERNTVASSTTGWLQLKTLAATSTCSSRMCYVEDSNNLVQGTTYYYRLGAYNSVGTVYSHVIAVYVPLLSRTDVMRAASISDQNILAGGIQQTLGGFDVAIAGEDIYVPNITISLASSIAFTNFTSLFLYNQAGNIIAGPINATSSQLTFKDGIILPKGDTTLILKGNVYPDILSYATVRIFTNPKRDWLGAVGRVSGQPKTFSPSTVVSSATMTIKSPSLSVTPVFAQPQNVSAGTVGVEFGRFALSAINSTDDIRVNTVQIRKTATSSIALGRGISGLKLFDGSVLLTTGSNIVNPVGNTEVLTFFLDTPLVISRGTTTIIRLLGDIASDAPVGAQVRFDFSGVPLDWVVMANTSGSGVREYLNPIGGITTTIVSAPIPTAPLINMAYELSTSTPPVIKIIARDLSTNEDGFFLERSSDNIIYSQLALLPAVIGMNGSIRYLDYAITAGSPYYYRLKVFSAAGYRYSNIEGVVRAPTNLVATAINTNAPGSRPRIELTWQDTSQGEDVFVVYRSLYDNLWSATTATTTSKNVTRYSDHVRLGGIATSTRYYYWVRAGVRGATYADTDAVGSVNAIVTPVGAPPAPTAPTNLTSTGVNTVRPPFINLSWQDNASNEDGFIVERGWDRDTTMSYPFIATTTRAGVTSFHDTVGNHPYGFTATSSTYHYRVRAFNAGGSSYSNIVSGRVDAPVSVSLPPTAGGSSMRAKPTAPSPSPTSSCPGPYHRLAPDGRCAWSCGVGTSPDNITNECVCNTGFTQVGIEPSGRRFCFLDAIPPVVTFVLPVGNNMSTTTAKNTIPLISLDITDDRGIATSTARWTNTANRTSGVLSPTPYGWLASSIPLKLGANTITASVQDMMGNMGRASFTMTYRRALRADGTIDRLDLASLFADIESIIGDLSALLGE